MEETQQNVPPIEEMKEESELLLPSLLKRIVKTAVADAMQDVYLRLDKLERDAETSKTKEKDREEEATGEKTDGNTGFGGGDFRGDCDTGFDRGDYRGDAETSFDGDGEKAVGESGHGALKKDGMLKLVAAV
ncbi:hypothetical protein AtNW77_Chr2g0229581 [Arabidopsis thaliana]